MHTLSDIADLLNVSLNGAHGALPIGGANSLRDASNSEISYIASDEHLDQLDKTRAAAVIVDRKVQLAASSKASTVLIPVDDAELAFAQVLRMLAPPIPRPPEGTHQTASVAPSASVGSGEHIGPHVFIGDGARVGRNCVFHAGVYIGADVSVGDDCEFFPNVVVRERVTIGDRVVVHAGTVIGSDGFGYRWDGAKHAKIPQIGTVVIEDDVEIGSCACIDRAKFAATRIGRGTKIDNLVQVAHNVTIGPHCILAGQAGVAGSATLGAGVVLGGQSAVRDHITMGDGAMLAACSGVMEDVKPKSIVSGLPALPHRQSLREQAAIRRLPQLVAQVRELQEQIEEIRKSIGK